MTEVFPVSNPRLSELSYAAWRQSRLERGAMVNDFADSSEMRPPVQPPPEPQPPELMTRQRYVHPLTIGQGAHAVGLEQQSDLGADGWFHQCRFSSDCQRGGRLRFRVPRNGRGNRSAQPSPSIKNALIYWRARSKQSARFLRCGCMVASLTCAAARPSTCSSLALTSST